MRAGGGHLGRPPGAEERLLRPDLGVHNILHHPHPLPRVCAKGDAITGPLGDDSHNTIRVYIVGEMKFHSANGQ